MMHGIPPISTDAGRRVVGSPLWPAVGIAACLLLTLTAACDALRAPRRVAKNPAPAPLEGSGTDQSDNPSPQLGATAPQQTTPDESAPVSTFTPPVSNTGDSLDREESGVASASGRNPSEADTPPPVIESPAAGTPSVPTSVELSAGVALPQSLPTGTAMGFSVDYRFANGGPNPSCRYLWVIHASSNQPWVQPVNLQASGTLQTFVTVWRPREGPFKTQIVEVTSDGSRREVSPLVLLRAD